MAEWADWVEDECCMIRGEEREDTSRESEEEYWLICAASRYCCTLAFGIIKLCVRQLNASVRVQLRLTSAD